MAKIKCMDSNNKREVLVFVKGKQYAWCESYNGSGRNLIYKKNHKLLDEYKHVPTNEFPDTLKGTKLLIELLRKLEEYLTVKETMEQ